MQCSYGGIGFQLIKTTLYSHEPVMSDDKTELLFMRSVYELTMAWNSSATSVGTDNGAPAMVTGQDPGQTDVALRYHLMKPRQTFTLDSDDGDHLLTVPAQGFDQDPENGPTPLACRVTAAGPTTWMVSWRVQVATIECGTSGSLPPILSNRWTQSQSTGRDRLTTLHTRGLSVFRADVLAQAQQNADHFRNILIPGVPLGFQRGPLEVTINSAGTALMWSVTDYETFTSIGATDDARRMGVERFDAVFSLKSNPMNGVDIPSKMTIGQLDATAWGTKTSTRQGMFNWLAALAIERCAIPGGQVDPDKQPSIMSVGTSEDLHQPRVSLTVTMRYPEAKQARAGFGPLRTDFIGIDVIKLFSNDGKNPQLPNDNNTRGTYSAELFAAAIKSACSAPPITSGQPKSVNGVLSDNYTTQPTSVTVVISTGDDPTVYDTHYSDDDTSSGTYTTMTVETRLKTNLGKLAVPLCGPVVIPPASGSSDGSGGTTTPAPVEPEDDGGPGGGGSSDDGSDDGEDEPPQIAILTLSQPITEVEYHFEAERAFTYPAIPHPVVNDKNLVLMEELLLPMALGLDTDGVTPVYRIGGVYKYVMKRARKPGTPIKLGVHPWTDFNYDDDLAEFPAENFKHGLIDSNSSTSDEGDGSVGTDN